MRARGAGEGMHSAAHVYAPVACLLTDCLLPCPPYLLPLRVFPAATAGMPLLTVWLRGLTAWTLPLTGWLPASFCDCPSVCLPDSP
jgi:hypothetical protein